MQVIHDAGHARHYPKNFLVAGAPQPNPEVPRRAEVLLQAAVAAGHRAVPAEPHDRSYVARIHTPEYLRFLETVHQRWKEIPGASPEVIPNMHPRGRDVGYPASVVGQAGYHLADTACPIDAGTWLASLGAADCALTGADLLLRGEPLAYALCRPPGHHAYADQAGGFCYLNNAAIAAQQLRTTAERVAILDVDVHHGNGTQGIFYARDDVLSVSLHSDPIAFYPFFVGYAQERGEGRGLGYNLNLPLPKGTGDNEYLTALGKALQRIAAFRPHALVVALGLDAHEGDPFQGLKITTAGFGRIAAAIGELKLPTLLVQEGGYMNEALGPNLVSFLSGIEQQ
jgi:acetoin utilization deacetylase AcuC-like enzyme